MHTRGTFQDGLGRAMDQMMTLHEMQGQDPAALRDVKARMREAWAPDPGVKGAKEYECKDCGVMFWAWTRKAKDCCAECGAKREVACQESMRHKQGPYYERYVRKQLYHWHREAGRLGLLEPPCDCNDCPL